MVFGLTCDGSFAEENRTIKTQH